MAPPPNPSDANSNNDDPFGGMDPMAWLESLAKRQGANLDELTTAADIDVPMPAADTVVNGPGYTPGYDTGKPKVTPAAAPVQQQTPVQQAQPIPAQPTIAQQPTAQPVAAQPAAASDDPFGGMDPMAWLESLAKRQGASLDELTTAANIDVPMPSADTVITGPGYTPGYDTGKPKATPAAVAPVQQQTPVQQAQPIPTQPVSAQPPVTQPSVAQPAAAQPTAASDDPFGGMDPMAWLESLAKRQGANLDELTTAANIDVPMPSADTAVTGPGYTPGYDTGKPKAAPAAAPVQQPSVQQAQPIPAQAAASQPVAADDLLGGMDPMAWLETLAKRQGAPSNELTTAANLDIPEPPSGTYVDEPGYVDYSPFGEAAPASAATETPTMSADEAEALLGLNTSNTVEMNPLSEMDPLAWLESLSAPPINSTDYSVFDSSPSMETSEAMEAASALSWLEQLARENQGLPSETPADTLDVSQMWIEADMATANNENNENEVGGASNDLAEVQRWLNQQADNLASIHDQDDTSDIFDNSTDAFGDETYNTDAFDALSTPEPGALPDWLMQQMPSNQPHTDALSDEILEPPTPANLPSWLLGGTELDLSETDDVTLDVNQFFGASEPVTQPEIAESEATSAADLNDLQSLIMPTDNDAPDLMAQALDEEYERKRAGDDSIPDWYVEALGRFGDDETPEPVAALPPQPSPDMIEPDNLPDWLSGIDEPQEQSIAEADALPGDIPDWLRQASTENLTSTPEAETDLGAFADLMDSMDLPDWLRPNVEEPAASAAPVAAPAEIQSQAQPEVVAPTPSLAPSPVPEPVVTRPVPEPVQRQVPPPTPVARPTPVTAAATPAVVTEDIPANHAQRLRHARELVAQNRHVDSLTHYEALIDDNAALDDVITDMSGIVAAQPQDPRARRLLGDAHLRKGNLQDALDTYRSALDKL